MLIVKEIGQPDYDALLSRLSRRGDSDLDKVAVSVKDILERVAEGGDEAVFECARQFESRRPTRLRIPMEEIRAAENKVDPKVRGYLREAADRIRRYHEHQKSSGFEYEEDGIQLGMRVLPLRSVGLYAPGGTARYPSSVLMAAIPASVAGVARVVLSTPSPTPELLYAAHLSGVTEVIDAGGAQAIAALAYGTESVGAVDKIVGPGNIYVACAKKMVFGRVAIDSIAGPSEILVLTDGQSSPAFAAADLLSQAEHDKDAYPLLVVAAELDEGRAFVAEVEKELTRQLSDLPRQEIAETALSRNGYTFITGTLEEGIRVTNSLAPEHLNVATRSPRDILPKLHSAGAIFLGAQTPEAAGDYAAGPSHVLPTGGATRFASPLGVYDFIVRSSVIEYSAAALRKQGDLLAGFARLEGLEAHARAVLIRTQAK